MNDRRMRLVLWISAAFNFAVALMFVFPDLAGEAMAMPGPVPRIYTILLAVFVGLFGGAYAWLAMQRQIDRPMVALGAIGKTAVVVVIVAFFMAGDFSAAGAALSLGDVLFAGLFTWWLVGTRATQAAAAV